MMYAVVMQNAAEEARIADHERRIINEIRGARVDLHNDQNEEEDDEEEEDEEDLHEENAEMEGHDNEEIAAEQHQVREQIIIIQQQVDHPSN